MHHLQSAIIHSVRTLVVLALLAWPTLAADEPPVIKAWYDTFEEVAGDRPTHDSLEVADDGTITLKGVNIVLSAHQTDGEDIRQEFRIEEAVLSDVRELDTGLFEIGKASIKHAVTTVSSPTVTFMQGSMPVIEAEGLIVRGPERITTPLDRWLASQLLARAANVPLLSIGIDTLSFDVHDLRYSWKGDVATGLGEWTFEIGSFLLPEEMIAANDGPFSLQDLGYVKLEAGIAGKSSIGLTGELVDLGFEVSLVLKDMGTFTFGADLGGVQQQFIQLMQAMRDAPESVDVDQAMAMGQTITVKYFKLRYDDNSLAGRVLDYQAQKEGKPREQIIAEALEAGEFGLMGFNTPELVAQAKAALEAFLNNPGWIQFEARPAVPISVEQFMQSKGTPADAAKLLNIQISAGPPAAKETAE
jgi:hypothetical protein